MAYQPILNSEVAQGQPLTSSLITRLRDNPLTLITMEPTELTSGTSYPVPTGVNLLMVICVGGGGGGGRGINSSSFLSQGGSSGCVKCGFVVPSSSTITYSIGSGGLGGGTTTANGEDGGDTSFNNSIIGKGGIGGAGVGTAGFPAGTQRLRKEHGAVNSGGAGGDYGEQTMITGGTAGSPSAAGGGGGGAGGVPWFLRTSSLGNGGNGGTTTGGNATGRGAGGGGGGGPGNGGVGSGGIIFVFPLQG